MSETKGQVGRFVAVGITVVLLDALTTFVLLGLEVPPGWAKGIGFATGAVYAYFANLRFTFRADVGKIAIVWFIIVYVVNMVINSQLFVFSLWAQPEIYRLLGLDPWLGDPKLQETVAFLIANGTSAVLNFLGMKFIVFRPRASS